MNKNNVFLLALLFAAFGSTEVSAKIDTIFALKNFGLTDLENYKGYFEADLKMFEAPLVEALAVVCRIESLNEQVLANKNSAEKLNEFKSRLVKEYEALEKHCYTIFSLFSDMYSVLTSSKVTVSINTLNGFRIMAGQGPINVLSSLEKALSQKKGLEPFVEQVFRVRSAISNKIIMKEVASKIYGGDVELQSMLVRDLKSLLMG